MQKFGSRKRAAVVNMNYNRNIDLVSICSGLSLECFCINCALVFKKDVSVSLETQLKK